MATRRLLREGDASEAVLRFYRATFAAAALYFTALPATCILAHLLNPWNRKKVVASVELGARFGATAVLAFVLRPSKLDRMINARMETGDTRQRAVELSEGLSGDASLFRSGKQTPGSTNNWGQEPPHMVPAP